MARESGSGNRYLVILILLIICYLGMIGFGLKVYLTPPASAVMPESKLTEVQQKALLKRCGSATIILPDGSESCFYFDWQKEELKKYGKTGLKSRKRRWRDDGMENPTRDA